MLAVRPPSYKLMIIVTSKFVCLMKFSSINARYDIFFTERQWKIYRQRRWSEAIPTGLVPQVHLSL
jgi:hypothetical protein